MTARVFISYRSSDGADKATALARDLDARFGNAQVFIDKEDLPAGARWRDAIASALQECPILLRVDHARLPRRHRCRGQALHRARRRPGPRRARRRSRRQGAHHSPALRRRHGAAGRRQPAAAVRPAERAAMGAPARLRLARGLRPPRRRPAPARRHAGRSRRHAGRPRRPEAADDHPAAARRSGARSVGRARRGVGPAPGDRRDGAGRPARPRRLGLVALAQAPGGQPVRRLERSHRRTRRAGRARWRSS